MLRATVLTPQGPRRLSRSCSSGASKRVAESLDDWTWPPLGYKQATSRSRGPCARSALGEVDLSCWTCRSSCQGHSPVGCHWRRCQGDLGLGLVARAEALVLDSEDDSLDGGTVGESFASGGDGLVELLTVDAVVQELHDIGGCEWSRHRGRPR